MTPQRNRNTICIVPGCGKIAIRTADCQMHYGRKRKYGSYDLPPQPTPTARFWAKVDTSGGPDTCWPWTGKCHAQQGYGRFHLAKVNGQDVTTNAHRFAWQTIYGPVPDGLVIDHMCHNPPCVNPAHLQAVTEQMNIENRAGATKVNPLGVRGVRRIGGRYQGRARKDGVEYSAGLFATIEEAEAAVIALRNELFTNNLIDRRRSA